MFLNLAPASVVWGAAHIGKSPHSQPSFLYTLSLVCFGQDVLAGPRGPLLLCVVDCKRTEKCWDNSSRATKEMKNKRPLKGQSSTPHNAAHGQIIYFNRIRSLRWPSLDYFRKINRYCQSVVELGDFFHGAYFSSLLSP